MDASSAGQIRLYPERGRPRNPASYVFAKVQGILEALWVIGW
jgi:hypothetical protein